MKLKMKNRSHRYDLNRPKLRQRHKYSKYEKSLSMIMLYVLTNTQATFETQFMKKLSNTKTELKKKKKTLLIKKHVLVLKAIISHRIQVYLF